MYIIDGADIDVCETTASYAIGTTMHMKTR